MELLALLIPVAVGLSMLLYQGYMKKHGILVEAYVVDVEYPDDSGDGDAYTSHLEYYVEGIRYHRNVVRSASVGMLDAGEKVAIYCLKSNPYRIMFEASYNPRIAICIIATGILIFLAYITMVTFSR